MAWWHHHESDNELLQDIKELLIELVKQGSKAKSLVLKISSQHGGTVGQPVTLVVGAGAVQSTVAEFSGPNGTGTQVPITAAIAFASDNSAVATVDPASGLVTAVSAGTANISATDPSNNLSDSVAVTVTAAVVVAESLVLTVPPQAPAAVAAVKAEK
jgi:hypothetical protein